MVFMGFMARVLGPRQQMQQMAMVGGVGVEMENPEMPEELSSAAGGDFSGYNMISG